MSESGSFDVSAFLNRQRIGSMHLLVLTLCGFVMIIDGYDILMVGYLLPAIAKEFQITAAQVAPIFIVQQVGLALGSFAVSPIADRFGRRNILLLSVALFSVLTLAATQAHSIAELATLRFLAGLFFSGAIANAIAITSEIAPQRLRSTLVTVMYVGYVLGTTGGGTVVIFLQGSYGWQSAFWIGGLLPLALLPVLYLGLPESLRFLVQRNDRDPRIAAMLARIDPALSLAGNERFVLREVASTGIPVSALFRDRRAKTTLLLWVTFFMTLLAIALMGAWMPTLFRLLRGVSVERAAVFTMIFSASGALWQLFIGRVIDAVGASRVLMITYSGGFLAIAALGLVDVNSPLLYVTLFFTGGCVSGSQGGINALSATLYPTRMRTTGVGWALGAGRIGGMLGPVIGGMLVSGGWQPFSAFLVMAVPMLVCAAATFAAGFTAAVVAASEPSPAAATADRVAPAQ